MAVAYYRDPVTREWVPLGGATGPSGAAGPVGAPGPTGVSGDTGNTAVTGSDGLPFVPGIDTTAMDTDYVNLTGDTMTGELLLAGPPTAPAEVAARGYVDQVTTVSDVAPDPVANLPARDNLVWFVVGEPDAVLPPWGGTNWEQRPIDWLPNIEVAPSDQKIGLLIHVPDGGTGSASLRAVVTGATQYTVDWGDGTAPETLTSDSQANHAYDSASLPATPLTSDGMRQVWAIVTPVGAGTFTGLNFISTGTPADVVEIVVGPGISLYAGASSTVFKKVKHVDFLEGLVLTSCVSTFSGYSALVTVTGTVDTSASSTFYGMFYGCASLAATGIPTLNTSNGTDFSYMFFSCSNVGFTAGPALDTSKGTNFSGMFQACGNLVSVPLYNTALGTNFNSMFGSCTSLTTTGVPALNTSNGTDFSNMFVNCNNAGFITGPPLDTSKGTKFDNMFNNCRKLVSIPLYNTALGTSFAGMFQYCTSLPTAGYSALDTSSGTNFNAMFYGCDLDGFTTGPPLDTSKGTNFGGMFDGCRKLVSIPLYNTALGTNFKTMFQNCTSLPTTGVPALNTSNGTDFSSMFYTCNSVGFIAGPPLDTSKGTNFSKMFRDCNNMVSVPAYDVSQATDSAKYDEMFVGCFSLNSILATGFKWTFSVQDTDLTSAALDILYGNLATVTGQTITVSTVSGASGDTPSIAEAKGWTVVG